MPRPIERSNDQSHGYRIYRFVTPLEPGAEMTLCFGLASKASRDDEQLQEMSPDGARLHMGRLTPGIGYTANSTFLAETDDRLARQRYGLSPRPRLPGFMDRAALHYNCVSADSDLIDFEATICTDRDQQAVASGRLLREWMAGDRRC